MVRDKEMRSFDMERFGNKNEKFSEKTTDPMAADYDEATEIFLSGVKLARMGDLGAAAPQIACAYLLDGRSINFVPVITMNENVDAASMKKIVLDYELLGKLIEHDESCISSSVLRILLATHMGPLPKYGQGLIAAAMVHIDHLLNYIENHREVEDPNSMIMGGCLSRKALLVQKSSLNMAMGEYKMAEADLTKALGIDESYVPAREARACIWAGTKMKDFKKIYKEFVKIVNESHEDHRGNEVAYAWLALSILGDTSLGSFADAKKLYKKSIKAVSRRDEIYGKRRPEELPSVVKVMCGRFQQVHGDSNTSFENDLSTVTSGMQNTSVTRIATKQLCVKCGATTSKDGGLLMQCRKCKSAEYCSLKCRNDDLKDHKKYCKIMKRNQAAASSKYSVTSSLQQPEQSVTEAENDTAQEKLDSWTSNLLVAKRLEEEFGKLFQTYGEHFSEWWKEMCFNEQKRTLLELTHCSIPLKEPSHEDITRKLSDQSMMSRALFDYNVQALCGVDGNLLREMSHWANEPREMDERNLCLSIEKRNAGVFPDLFGGKLAFVTPPAEEDEIMGSPFVFTDAAPAAEVQHFRNYMSEGLVYDASAFQFATSRKIFSLCLLVKLFDQYQVQVRRIPSTNPMERLNGCQHCNRSCQGASAKRCSVCKVAWFCNAGCMNAALHVPCPLNKECDSKAIFN